MNSSGTSELCRRMKNSEILREILVILLTALSDPKKIIRGLESGAVDSGF